MIVRFAVSNFLSFDYSNKPKDCINMKPSRIKQKGDHLISDYNLLRSMVMFGGNGAGKSSIVKALRFLKDIVTTGKVPKPEDGYYCKNNEINIIKPIRMEIEIIKRHSGNDASYVMDYLNVRSPGWGIKIDGDEQKSPWTHYKYTIELQYVGENLPYNIAYETGSSMLFDRESGGFEIKGKIDPESYVKNSSLSNQAFVYKKKKRAELIIEIEKLKQELEDNQSEYNYLQKVKSVMISRGRDAYNDYFKDLMDKNYRDKKDKNDDDTAFNYWILMRDFINKDEKTDDSINEFDWKPLLGKKSYFDSIIDDRFQQYFVLKEEIEDTEKRIEANKMKSEVLSSAIAEKTEIITKMDQEIEASRHSKKRSITINDKPMIFKLINNMRVNESQWNDYVIAKEIHDWFLNTLVLVDIRGKVMPIKGFDELDNINALLPYFDAHVKGLTYVPVTSQKEIEEIYFEMRYGKNRDFLELIDFTRSTIGRKSTISRVFFTGNNIYQLDYKESRLTINKLVTIHNDGSIHELMEESDGTHRLVELISVLVKTDSDKVYVIDELDRRLHPLITKNFIDMYYKLGLENTQLIITTHETRLATTELFRMDEINFVGHDENYCTVVRRASDVVKDRDKRLDELYLNNMLFGTPEIKG